LRYRFRGALNGYSNVAFAWGITPRVIEKILHDLRKLFRIGVYRILCFGKLRFDGDRLIRELSLKQVQRVGKYLVQIDRFPPQCQTSRIRHA